MRQPYRLVKRSSLAIAMLTVLACGGAVDSGHALKKTLTVHENNNTLAPAKFAASFEGNGSTVFEDVAAGGTRTTHWDVDYATQTSTNVCTIIVIDTGNPANELARGTLNLGFGTASANSTIDVNFDGSTVNFVAEP